MIVSILLTTNALAADCDNLLAATLAAASGVATCQNTVVDMNLIPQHPAFSSCGGQDPNTCADLVIANISSYPYTSVGGWQAVMLDGLSCSDGTQAFYYVKPGTTGNAVVRLNGHSGRCEGLWDAANNQAEQLPEQSCAESAYNGDVFHGWMATSAPIASHVDGILSDSSPFASDTRVWVPSCAGDNYMGTSDLTNVTVHLPDENGTAYTVGTIPRHGRDIVDAVLTDLGIAAGARVVMVGTSGGSFGLTMTLDHFASQLSGVEVLGVLDSNQDPGLEAMEAHFDANASCTAFGDASCADFASGPSSTIDFGCDVGDPGCETFDISPAAYWAPGQDQGWKTYTIQGFPLDDSCTTYHPYDAKCRNPEHVRNHHLSTPVFVAQSLKDAGLFGAGGNPNPVEFTDPGLTWADLAVADPTLMDEMMGETMYEAVTGHANAEEFGTTPRAVWTTTHQAHELTRTGTDIVRTTCSTRLVDALEDWLTDSSRGDETWVSGYGGCP
ncbi:MAG: hypothetical protein KC621_11865 [Myxococcales bacterium]|nr:hypothetical protein [Myxococcales bacterium]